MRSLILRSAVSLLISTLLFFLEVLPSSLIANPLFTVIGVIYSILMGLLVSFDASKLYNHTFKTVMRAAVQRDMKWLSIDFAIDAVCFVVISLTENEGKKACRYLDFVFWFAICVLTLSLIYEVWNFYIIYQRNVELQDRIMEEEKRK